MTRRDKKLPPYSWSEWLPLPGGWSPSPAVLAETLDGGQAFRWQRDAPDVWTGTWSDNVAQLRRTNDLLEWRAPAAISKRVASALPAYLGLDVDWTARADSLPWRSDAHLATCLREFSGLRLLRQPFGETLLGFLCSATKQIVQIKQMVALLAARHGAPLVERVDLNAFGGAGVDAAHLYRLPTWTELAAVPEKELRGCLLGFRARFIHETALFLAKNPAWLAETERLPYVVAKARLLELPGVGEKVADCVLLFGAAQLEAFPVDVWILKTLERRYGLAGWKPARLAQFGRAHFGPLAGYAQQFLFSWERKNRKQ
ncbi:MAG: DNA-binding protein [Opitutae bacterium]|nr:DNA-binding protein [Opitutae bacterium]